jgi:hypothetical protein
MSATAARVRLPDIAIGFGGVVDGYGRLARALLDLDRMMRTLRPITAFRCHRTQRRMRLVGDVPLEEPPVAGLARVGTALGMSVVCTLHLPRRAAAARSLPTLANVGGIRVLVLDVSAVPVETAHALRTDVRSMLDTAQALGLEVEIRGAIPVIRAAGMLHAEYLDSNGVTIHPDTASVADRVRSSAELFLTIEGLWHMDERAWRRGDPAIGSVHAHAEELAATLRTALAHWPGVRLGTDLSDGRS